MQPWGRVRGAGTAFLTMVAALGTRMPRWSLIPPPLHSPGMDQSGGHPIGQVEVSTPRRGSRCRRPASLDGQGPGSEQA